MEYHFLKLDGEGVLNPGPLYDAAVDLGLPTNFWGFANSVTVSAGMDPDTAWLIVPRTVAEALYTTELHTITWEWQQGQTRKTLNLGGWVLVRATLIGIDGDLKSPYLLELRDKRELMKHSVVIEQDFNTTVGWDGSAKIYRDSTTNASTPWTWQELLEELWDLLPSSIRGTAPTLDWTPPHDPEYFHFSGIPVWDAIGEVLRACQSTLAPTADGFQVVSLGGSQSTLSAFQSSLSHRLVSDGRPLFSRDMELYPEKVRVHFLHRTFEPDDDRTKREDVATSLQNARTGYIVDVWSDLIWEGTSTNDSDISTSKASVAARVALLWSIPALSQWYSGLYLDVASMQSTAFSLGPRLHRIRVRDYGDDDGLVTEISTLAELMRPQLVRRKLLPRPWILDAVVVEAGGIASNATGTVEVWLNDAATGLELEAANTWMQGVDGVDLAEGDEVLIKFSRDKNDGEGGWEIVGANC